MPSPKDNPTVGKSSQKKWARIANKKVQQTGNLKESEQFAKRFVRVAMKKRS